MPTLDELRSERAAIMARVERLDGWIATLEKLEKDYTSDYLNMHIATPNTSANGRAVGDALSAFAQKVTSNVGALSTVKRGPNGSSPELIVDAAVIAITGENRPMTRYELVEAVEATGLTVGGVDKARNMGTILWRSGRFDNDGDGYKPKGWTRQKDFDL